MDSIYQNKFEEYLESRLGFVKTTSKNFITVCPWCEFGQKKDHYHLYISTEAPIFHCFHAGCEEKGTLKKLLRKIEGHDISDKFVDQQKIKSFKIKKIETLKKESRIVVPELNANIFKEKDFYIRSRLKFPNMPTSFVKGLVYDINQFIEINNVVIDPTLFRLKDYLQNNFVGFLTENKSTLVLRNIDSSSEFRYFKMKLDQVYFADYYRLSGGNQYSNKVVVAEGVFDIFTEFLYDSTNLKNECKLYATALSANYSELLKSIVFNENIFRMDVIVLSDRGLTRDFYRKLKNYNIHIIDRLTVYYNENGKDFNVTPIVPIKIVID